MIAAALLCLTAGALYAKRKENSIQKSINLLISLVFYGEVNTSSSKDLWAADRGCKKYLRPRSCRNEKRDISPAMMNFYRALPKVAHIRYQPVASGLVETKSIEDDVKNMLEICSKNSGVVYAEISICPVSLLPESNSSDDKLPELRLFTRNICKAVREFEESEAWRLHRERRLYRSRGIDEHVAIIDRYRLALVPRLVIDLSLLSDDDAISLIEYISDFNFDFRQYVVGIELDVSKSIVPPNTFQGCEPKLTLAKYHGLKVSVIGLTRDLQGAEQKAILDFEPDRLGNILELPSSMLNKLTDEMTPLAYTCPANTTNAQDYWHTCEWNMMEDKAIILSSSGNGSSTDILEDFVAIAKARNMNNHDVAKLSLDAFHHILETSRKTRSELVRCAVIRTDKILIWANDNVEEAGLRCEP